MKEVSFKFIFFICFINIFCFAESISPNTYNFVFNNYIPNKISNNNIGIKYSFSNKQNFILSQNWISNNLYIGGYFSSNSIERENEKINYTLNLGYKTSIDFIKNINVIYDFGIHNKRNFLDSKEKWKKISIILNYNFFAISYNYLLSKCSSSDVIDSIENCNKTNDNKNASFIGIDFFNNVINNNFFINFGIRKSGTSIFPHFSLRYNL